MLFFFIQNMTFIISFVFLSMKLDSYISGKPENKKIFISFASFLGGLLSIIVMTRPFLYEGMIFDLRAVPVFLIAYSLGLRAGLVSTILPSIYRFYLGGTVAWPGVIIGILIPAIVGGICKKVKIGAFLGSVLNVKRMLRVFLLLELVRLPFMKFILNLPLEFFLKFSLSMILCEMASLLSIVLIINETIEHKLKEEELKASEEQYRYLIETSPQAMVIFQENVVVYVNKAVVQMAKAQSAKELIGKSIFQFIVPEDHERAIFRISKILEDLPNSTGHSEFKLTTVDGQVHDVEVLSKGITFKSHPAILITLYDVTAQKREHEEMSHKAYHDALTGLPNRYLLVDYFERAVHRSIRKSKLVSIMFIDLDRFKLINDTLGHDIGDIVLKGAVNRIENSVRGSDIVFRHGGDEFIVLLEEINHEGVAKVAQRVIDAFVEPFMVEGNEIYTSPSVGISLYPTDGKNLETLIKNADLAMYYAKDQGRNNFQFYTYNEEINRKMRLEVDLRKALDQDQFTLYYQPQMDFNEDRVIGIEALLRWNHPILGLIRPGEFLALLEETGYIVPIGYWVIEQACWQNVQWQKEGISSVPVVVNVSVRQLHHQEFVETIQQILVKTKLNPEHLELEIMESMIQNRTDELVLVLQKLKNLGVRITIDNFGTGYSVLNIYKQISFDNLKIDHSFVEDILINHNTANMVKAIIELGRTLNFNVIAAGIEGADQIAFLKENRCNFGQGYYFSKPMPGKEVTKVLQQAKNIQSCI